jgi:hypothetical protein
LAEEEENIRARYRCCSRSRNDASENEIVRIVTAKEGRITSRISHPPRDGIDFKVLKQPQGDGGNMR